MEAEHGLDFGRRSMRSKQERTEKHKQGHWALAVMFVLLWTKKLNVSCPARCTSAQQAGVDEVEEVSRGAAGRRCEWRCGRRRQQWRRRRVTSEQRRGIGETVREREGEGSSTC